MIRGVLFDLDGTLADTLADIGDAMNFALRERGLPGHAPAAYRGFIGEGVRVLAERAAPGLDDASLGALVAAYQRRYAGHMLDATRAYPGIPELLDALAARRVPMAVLSNKPDEPTARMCDALFGAGRFVAAWGQHPDRPRKPDPAAALALAGKLGVPAAEIAFVGDTAIDMHTARAAAMIAVGVAWGFRAEELAAEGAVHTLDRPAELLALLA
jgi:phosphoglycolate phosphatase